MALREQLCWVKTQLISTAFLSGWLTMGQLVSPVQAQSTNQITVSALNMQKSQTAGDRSDHIIIFGNQTDLVYLAYDLANLPSRKFNLKVEAAGESGDGRWPNLAVAFDNVTSFGTEVPINATEFRTYDLGNFDASSNSTIYLVFTNDYYNPAIQADVNVKVRSATFELAGSGGGQGARTGADTAWVAGSSGQLTWDKNRESDLAGYIVYQGHQSGNYVAKDSVGNANTYSFEIAPGQHQFFAVTAYDQAGNESGLSNEILVAARSNQVDPGAGNIADLNGDGVCDDNDRTILSQAMGSTSQGDRYAARADLNNDGKVDGVDLIIFNSNCSP